MRIAVIVLASALGLLGCSERRGPRGDQRAPASPPVSTQEPASLDLDDDPVAYLTSATYRRGVLERDLVDPEPIYARVRLRHYSLDHARGWDRLPVIDWPTVPLTTEHAASIAGSQRLPEVEFGPPLAAAFGSEEAPVELPKTHDEWIALGERVFFEYPMSIAPVVGRALRAGADLRDYGVIEREGAYIGVRLGQFDGHTRVALTCAICHACVGEDGVVSGVRANRAYDLGRLRLDHGGANERQLVDATQAEDLHKLGPGRSDVQRDREFNPYAFPDFGGIADMPFLHHTANWYNRGVATLAIRVETVFMTRGRVRDRPPRVLTWALAEYLRSLPPPAPVAEPSEQSARGRMVFEAEGCQDCHEPPLFTTSQRVTLDEIGTDPAAGLSRLRGTGHWRVPSLRGVGGNAPYLHHGAFATLEQMFEPTRDEPGHRYGLDLDGDARGDLLAFLRTI